ncbi:hypothetical protein E4U41_000745, partial [Claviceps citrina]
ILTPIRHHLHFLHILVDRLARSHVRPARIHVQFNVMPGRVLRVIWWDCLSFAFAERMNLASSAERPTTKTAGAVRKYVKIFFRAENTLARGLAILDSVGNAI